MKILTISEDLPPYILGGSGRIALESSLGLARRGHDVTILTCAPREKFPMTIDGVVIETVQPKNKRTAHYRSVFSQSRAQEVMRIIRHVRPDIIHAHGLAWQIGYRWIPLAKAMGIPVVYTAHGVMHLSYGKVYGDETLLWLKDVKRARWEFNPLRTTIAVSLLNQCDRIVAVSDALRLYLEPRMKREIVTIHNGIDTTFWKPIASRAEARIALGIRSDAPALLLAGRLGHDKGVTAVRNALPDDAILLVAGELNERDLASLGPRAHYLGSCDAERMRLAYAASDATLVPSVYLDPFPTMCLESQACGKPAIATTWGGAKESIVNGTTGWVVDPTDVTTFSERLAWCSDHASELSKAGENARTHIETHFSLDRFLDDLEALYAPLMRAAGATSRA